MRNRQILLEIEDIMLLWQYLYMSEEHSIVIQNAIGVPLRITMDDEGALKCQNLNFPAVPPTTAELQLMEWLGIIDQLKEQPLHEMKGWNVGEGIQNRWDEIKVLTKTNLSLNRK